MPNWANNVVAGLALAGFIFVTKCIGWGCRRLQPRWAGMVVALAMGGGLGFGVGAGVIWMFFREFVLELAPDSLNTFMVFLGVVLGLIGAIEAVASAAGLELKGTARVRIGK